MIFCGGTPQIYEIFMMKGCICMKRKQILARAITLGLLLALPCSAWAETEIDNTVTLENETTYSGGLLVKENGNIQGAGNDLKVDGTFSYTPNFLLGVVNEGTITGVDTLSAGSVYNNGGVLEVQNLQLAGAKYDAQNPNWPKHFSLYNEGTNAKATIGGGTLIGWTYNDEGAVLNITGDTTFKNHEKEPNGDALTNIAGSTINISDGVTVTTEMFNNGTRDNTDATLNAANAKIFINGNRGKLNNYGIAEIGTVESDGQLVGSGDLRVCNFGSLTVNHKLDSDLNNLGTFVYNGTETINGLIINFEKMYVTNGKLNIKG